MSLNAPSEKASAPFHTQKDVFTLTGVRQGSRLHGSNMVWHSEDLPGSQPPAQLRSAKGTATRAGRLPH